MNEQFRQLILHAVDERGDPVRDYHVQLYGVDGTGEALESRIEEFDADMDVYSGDPSHRCFHMDVASLLPEPGGTSPGLSIRWIASSSTT